MSCLLKRFSKDIFIRVYYVFPKVETSPGFYLSAVQVFRKHCGKKEKLLVEGNFFFSHSVFYPLGELSSNLKSLNPNSFSLEESKIFHLGKAENSEGCGKRLFSRWQNSQLVHIESIRIHQNKCDSTIEENTVGAQSPLLYFFQKSSSYVLKVGVVLKKLNLSPILYIKISLFSANSHVKRINPIDIFKLR